MMEDARFHELLERFRLSRPGYRKVRKGVKKRIARHMQALGRRSVGEYLALVDADPAVRDACFRLLTVSVSRFFRDRRLWEVLETDILPDLLKTAGDPFKVWCAGCACGEEPYTFNIVWRNAVRRRRGEARPRLQLTATDVHPGCLSKARKGVYAAASLREIPPERRDQWFIPRKNGTAHAVRDALKSDIRWVERDLRADPPDAGFSVIFLRNSLLTYYQTDVTTPVFRKIVRALGPGGVLVIGAHETLPGPAGDLEASPLSPLVFARKT